MPGDRPLPVPPLITTLILVRHGETAWNREKRLQGQIDTSLSGVGEGQAQALASRFEFAIDPGTDVDVHLRSRIDAVLSSDLSRAMATAAPLAAALGLSVIPEPGLRERHYGVFQGTTRDQIAEQRPDDHARWMRHDPEFAPEGGESMRQLFARVVGTLRLIAKAHPGKTVVCVTHGGVLDCAYRFAAPLPLEAPRQHTLLNASVNVIEWQGSLAGRGANADVDTDAEDSARVIAWGDVAHLSATKDDSI